jgi:hypothetical protein
MSRRFWCCGGVRSLVIDGVLLLVALGLMGHAVEDILYADGFSRLCGCCCEMPPSGAC